MVAVRGLRDIPPADAYRLDRPDGLCCAPSSLEGGQDTTLAVKARDLLASIEEDSAA